MAHDGVIYDTSDSSVRFAVRRHFAKLYPDYPIPGETQTEKDTYKRTFDARLRRNQREWFGANTRKMKDLLDASFGPFSWDKDMREEALKLRYIPHKKRAIREAIGNLISEELTIAKDIWVRNCTWFVKPGEYAKGGDSVPLAKRKYPRIVVDMQVASSLQTVVFAADVKHHQDGKLLEYKGCDCLFLSNPSPERIAQELLRLWNSQAPVSMLIFSDDAVLSITYGGKRYVINLDFSGNDSTKTLELFRAQLVCNGASKDVSQAILDQIQLPIVISNHDQSQTAIFRSNEGYLQSGIGITTCTNNFSHQCGFVNLVDNLRNVHDEISLIQVYELIGHKITCDYCEIIEDMQFLKMSLVLTSLGYYIAVLNLGVICRATGVCKGDLPGRGDLAKRAEEFQSNLMNGLLTGIDYPPLRRLQPGAATGDVDLTLYAGALYSVNLSAARTHTHDPDNFYRRYRATENEVQEFEQMIEQLGVGRTMYCTLVDKILKKDYSLACPGV